MTTKCDNLKQLSIHFWKNTKNCRIVPLLYAQV